MNNDITLFGDTNTAISPVDQAFGWDDLSPQELIPLLTEHHQELKKQESVADALKHDASVKLGLLYIVAKGKLGHGYFVEWLESQDISRQKASEYMKIAQELADELTANVRRGGHLPHRILREIAYSPNPKLLLAKVESGEVDQTLDAIKAEKQKLLEAKQKAEEDARKAKVEESKARADAKAAQQRLLNFEHSTTKEIEALTKQLEEKRHELETLIIPEIELREVPVEVLPQSTKNDIEEMKKRINELKANLDQANKSIEKEKGNVPQAVLDQIKEMQTQIGTYRALVDQKERAFEELSGHNKKIAEMNRKLSENVRIMSAETQASVGRTRIRQKWRTDTTELHVAITKFVTEIPSLVDQEALEGDDWSRQAQCMEILQRALSALNQMGNSRSESFVESSFVDSDGIIDENQG